jgi:UDP-N-acetylmuramoyl-L-alanyl-D-glutamate--2,6-diaminopimelate ligase
MEVSSHALDQERVAGITFNVGVITNVTQDHLDYHATMDAYAAAKTKLFSKLRGDKAFGVVNLDDPYANRFRAALTARCVTYGTGGDYRAEDVSIAADGSRFTLITPTGSARVRSALAGRHNIANVLAATAVAGGLGLTFEQIVAGIEGFTSVPGRFERVEAGQDFFVVVDYAHTDDGLRNVLATARELGPKRLIVVFGCGGDRDKGKRPKMGAVAAELGDYVIVTSDNPRSEDPAQIVSEIEAGVRVKRANGAHYEVIVDRERAINRAIGMAERGDLVMIAGKGHEDYQILGTNRIHFDDREVARAALESMQHS